MKGRCIHRQPSEQGEIQVWQQGERRSLWFDDTVLQSEIDLQDPAVLPQSANRTMLAHLLFGQQPQRVLLAGCGGGAIARWFAARSPTTTGDAVELSPQVAEIARQYFEFPNQQQGWQLHVANIRAFIQQPPSSYDFILVDLEEQQYAPDWLSGEEFLKACHQALSAQGVLTINLIPRDAAHYRLAVAKLREIFHGQTLSLPVAGHDNQLLIAFRQAPKLDQIKQQITQAARRWGLPFARYWQSLQSSNPPGCGIW